MKNNKIGWTEKDIAHKTKMNEWKINDLKRFIEKYDSDFDVKQRLEKQNCKVCYYQPNQMSLQAFTDSDCKNCNRTMTFSNSNIDRLCDICSREIGCCKHCGSKID